MRFPEFKGEWRKTSLGNCCTSFDYGLNEPAIDYDGVNRYLRITDINDFGHLINNEKKSPKWFSNDYLVNERDILLSRTGATVGKSYLYSTTDGKLYFAGYLIRAHIKESCSKEFIFQETQKLTYKKWVKLISARSGQPGINSKEYASFSFLAPNLSEQEKIGSLLSLIDQRIDAQRKTIEDLKIFKEGLLKEIINSFNEAPKVPLSYFASIINGYAFNPQQYSDAGKYKVVTIGNVDGSKYGNFTNMKYVQELPANLQDEQIISKGDILISMTGNVGRVSICPIENALLNQRVALLKLKEKYSSYKELIYQVISSPLFENSMNSLGQGAAQKNIGIDDILSFKVPNIKFDAVSHNKVNLLSNIDFLIQEEIDILPILMKIKQWLLKNLFV